jgi:hypothetical protein
LGSFFGEEEEEEEERTAQHWYQPTRTRK